MTTLLRLLAACVLLGGTAQAQQIDSGNITAGGTDCTVSARCSTIVLPAGTISTTLAISGTFVATLQIEGSSDAGVTWFSILAINLLDGSSATSETGTGQYAVSNAGLTHVRVRASAYTSGTATVTAVRGYATARWLTPFLTTGKFGDGSAGAPSITFQNETTLGCYRPAAGTMTCTGILFAKNNTPGNVAIGFNASSGFANNAGDNSVELFAGGVRMGAFFATGQNILNNLTYGWCSGTDITTCAPDTNIGRAGAPGKIVQTGTTPMYMLGGTTNLFPAWKQSGVGFAARLADDSTNTYVTAAFYNGNASSILASAATIAPTGNIHHVSGTTAIVNITVPAGCTPTCQITLIPDGLWTTTAAGNIALASTAVVNKALIMTWDGTKWNPSY